MPETREACETDKELKVKLPQRLIVKLHSAKILHGRTISATLTAALDAYYGAGAAKAAEEAARAAEPA